MRRRRGCGCCPRNSARRASGRNMLGGSEARLARHGQHLRGCEEAEPRRAARFRTGCRALDAEANVGTRMMYCATPPAACAATRSSTKRAHATMEARKGRVNDSCPAGPAIRRQEQPASSRPCPRRRAQARPPPGAVHATAPSAARCCRRRRSVHRAGWVPGTVRRST